ncbi:hypothetical protein LTR62_001603 [Meristemomyces frigidus]|uniref:RAVE complex protein Rav1 C-terminal domain-containing protein n=1 Tax=Meristemomyces frigidus TaxID=1508187 RepID=A0AAN7T852_9PEZI|nr:hypothetical protein LTR62_001603 [Meristemomyces frigidus]
MPSTSPGDHLPTKATSTSSNGFVQILPGAPNAYVQATATFVFRHKRYVAYISGSQLNLLSAPAAFVQAITFEHDLVAVAVEARTSRIAVASSSQVTVLEPIAEGWTRVWWEQRLRLCRDDEGDEASYLSWGSGSELIVGGSRKLSLFSTLPSSRASSPAATPVDEQALQQRKALWSKPVASALIYAVFCPSANVIASCGRYDRLVKIWRRLSFEEGLFDYAYLPHSAAVTHIEWRPADEHRSERRGSSISGRHEEDVEVLYTFASDGVLRVWRMGGMHDMQILVLHTTIDLVGAIPQSPILSMSGRASASKPPRYAFTIPAEAFSSAVTAALARRSNGKISHSLEHLKEIVTRSPDIIVTVDGHGRMSAWGIQSIGHKRRPDTPGSSEPFHIAHTEGLPLAFEAITDLRFQAWFSDDTIHVLAHSFDGHIQWWSGAVETFFSPSAPGNDRLRLEVDWCGHDQPVVGAEAGEQAVLTWAAGGEVAQWSSKQRKLVETSTTTVKHAKVHAAMIYDAKGSFVIVDDHDVTLYDPTSLRMSSIRHGLHGQSELTLASLRGGQDFVAYSSHQAVCFSVLDEKITPADVVHLASLSQDIDVSYGKIIASNCGGAVCLTIDSTGLLRRSAIRSSAVRNSSVVIYPTFETGISKARLIEATVDVAAIVAEDGKSCTILELKDGYVEYRKAFTQAVECLKFFRNAAGKHYLAVAHKHEVEVLLQHRYSQADATASNEHELDTWSTVKRLSIESIGLNITTLMWQGHNGLAVVAGNGTFLSGEKVRANELELEFGERLYGSADVEEELDLRDLSAHATGPVPVWHPKMIEYLVSLGRIDAAVCIVNALQAKLKFWSEGETLDYLLDVPLEALMDSSQRHLALDNDVVSNLREQMAEKRLPAISRSEQRHVGSIIEVLAYISEHRRGLDDNALVYLFSFKLRISQMPPAQTPSHTYGQVNGTTHPQQVPTMSWRDIAFASQSSTQQPLFDILTLHYDNKLTWPIARSLGLTAWLSEKEALATVFESLAQSAYRATSPPDPSNAALFFLALHKKATLLGLWRITTWHREQRATTNFLKRDFSTAEAKTAAKKNAYALMGKRRFEYAAAFFLLADDVASAVSLLAGQCGDAMLAVGVARLYGGEGLGKLVRERIIPRLETERERWGLSWCSSMLGAKGEAANVLIRPLKGVRMWWHDDPRTLVLYRQLRKVSGEEEYQAVLRSARLLRKMGLWLLALDLVQKWDFKYSSSTTTSVDATSRVAAAETTTNGIHTDEKPAPTNAEQPSFILDSFTPPEPVKDRAAQAAELMKKLQAKKKLAQQQQPPLVQTEKPKPPPTQFKEPDANSLLDSFGF